MVDYIIVGGGSAGCVLANRLSADPEINVALFEAGGGDRAWTVQMPAALTHNLKNRQYSWFFHTEPEPQLNYRQLYWPRGKVLGGCSSLNAMVYIRGHAKDYDRWHEEGATGWHYENVLPYFRRSETYSKKTLSEDDRYRGDQGPLKVTHRISSNPLFNAFIEAGLQAGYPYSEDFNGAQQEGFGRYDMTIHQGKRCSAATAYLTPISKTRKNLQCYLHAHTTKILFDGNKAIGIEYIHRQKTYQCYAQREVIIASGAINSPHLLMLSGIGPAAILKKHRINVLVDLPGVGRNLQDHLEFYIQYECKKPMTLYVVNHPLRRIAIGLQWFLTHTGLAASSHLESGAFICSRKSLPHPDLQFHFLPGLINNHDRSPGHCHAFQVHVGTLRPESRGHLELASNNPTEKIKIFANYLQNENDMRDLAAAFPITRDIFSQKAFKEYKGRELQPGIECASPEQIKAFIRAKADSGYHPCGTCKMGIDGMAVVDPRGSVYGVENLRIVDASIMPSIISGNLNAAVIMMAERLSDMILGKS